MASGVSRSGSTVMNSARIARPLSPIARSTSEIAKSFGADHVILYPKENTVARVLQLTSGRGVHAVFDGVGKDT